MKKVKLTSICRPKQWKTIPTSELQESGYPVYGANGIIGFYDSYNHEQETVAITCRGATCGTVNLTQPKSYITGNAMCLDDVDDNTVEIKFLFYAMQSYDFTKVISGSAQPQITREGLGKVEVALYPLDLQKQIVNRLCKVDELIERRRQQLKELDGLVKSRFIELFGNPELNEKSWKVNTFGDICKVRQGLQIPISKRLTDFETGCYVYITVQYLHGGKEREYIKNPKSTVICTENDVLMTRTGNTGMVITGVEGVFHNNFFLIDFDRSRYDKEFLVQYLNMDVIQNDIRRRAGTSTIPDLNHGDFYKIMIYEPPLELQQQFAAFVAQVDKSKLAAQKGLQELEILKKSLMQQYFG